MTGVCFLQELKNRQDSSGGTFQVNGIRPDIQNLFDIVSQRSMKTAAPKEVPKVHFIEAFGRTVAHFGSDLYDQVAFVGEVLSHLVQALSRPRSIRWKDVWVFIEKAGVDAVPLVILTGFLIGVIMAFQSALPLRQMGSDLFVANVVAFTVLRELGPLITAIILAGRTGSAIAAEIGTMKINEEIDALTTMGFVPVRFLVVSRILGILFLAPLLTIVCDFFGMVGGAVVFQSLGHSLATYMHQIITVVTLRDIFGGLLKAYPFAIAVAGVGCLRGLKTRTNASAVGESTTSSVVTGMVMVIILDGVISAIYYVLGV
jgi:phospholipid/cholesterol/gamma-HCH transport system permease protein